MELEINLTESQGFKKLCRGLANLNCEKDVKAFLRDLCTLKELEEISGRMEAATLIKEGVPYRSISKKTGVSTATVTRVAYWMKCGMGGYDLVLSHHHTPESSGKRLHQS